MILLKRNNINRHYSQVNDAYVSYTTSYCNLTRIVSCGPNAFIMGMDYIGKLDEKINLVNSNGVSIVQASDIVMSYFHNPFNFARFSKLTGIDHKKNPANEYMALYPLAAKDLLDYNDCTVKKGLTFDAVSTSISAGFPVMLLGKFPCGWHYVLVVGVDPSNGDSKKVVINDPYELNWKDRIGFNRVLQLKTVGNNAVLYNPEIGDVLLSDYYLSFGGC